MPYNINLIDEVSGRWHLCSLLRSRFLNFLAFYQNRNLSFYCNHQWRFKHIIGSQDSIIGVTHIFLSFSDILIGCWTFLSLYFLYNFYVLLLLFLSSPVYKLFKLTFGLGLYHQKKLVATGRPMLFLGSRYHQETPTHEFPCDIWTKMYKVHKIPQQHANSRISTRHKNTDV